MAKPIPTDLRGHLGLDSRPESSAALSEFLLARVHDLNNPVGALVLNLSTQRLVRARLADDLAAGRSREAEISLGDLERTDEQIRSAMAALRARLAELTDAAWSLDPEGEGEQP